MSKNANRIELDEREREALMFFYANPGLPLAQIAEFLLMKPSELRRLIRLAAGKEFFNTLADREPETFWPEYRIRRRTAAMRYDYPELSELAESALRKIGFTRQRE